MATLMGGEFVGRQREMGKLKVILEDALSSQGQLLMLVGEPGIGKTRTAQELAGHAETRGAQVLWGWCYERRVHHPSGPGSSLSALISSSGTQSNSSLKWAQGQPISLKSSPKSEANCLAWSDPLLCSQSKLASGCSTPSPPS